MPPCGESNKSTSCCALLTWTGVPWVSKARRIAVNHNTAFVVLLARHICVVVVVVVVDGVTRFCVRCIFVGRLPVHCHHHVPPVSVMFFCHLTPTTSTTSTQVTTPTQDNKERKKERKKGCTTFPPWPMTSRQHAQVFALCALCVCLIEEIIGCFV